MSQAADAASGAPLDSVEEIVAGFRERDYVCDRSLATAVFLALRLGRPLLLEGEAGVGKTELAKVLAASLGTRLIRLQCYEGLDVNAAVYEWNYPRQMLEIRLLEARGEADRATAHDIFGPDFLIRRPLLQALEADAAGEPPVLLIDEIDRADEEFEAYLLEILSDFQVTVPEIGTIKAARPPRVILTSNRTREVHDALKRRCLYHWIDYPTAQKEFEIVLARVPDAPERLAREVVGFVHRLREADLTKVPGLAESVGFGRALRAAGLATDLGAAVDFARALTLVDVGQRDTVRAAGQAVFVRRRDDREVYDRVFNRWWRRRGRKRPVPDGPAIPSEDEAAEAGDGVASPGGDEGTIGDEGNRIDGIPTPIGSDEDGGGEIDGIIAVPTAYSSSELLRHRDFDRMTAAELRDAERLVDLL